MGEHSYGKEPQAINLLRIKLYGELLKRLVDHGYGSRMSDRHYDIEQQLCSQIDTDLLPLFNEYADLTIKESVLYFNLTFDACLIEFVKLFDLQDESAQTILDITRKAIEEEQKKKQKKKYKIKYKKEARSGE